MRRGLSLPVRTAPRAKPWYKRDGGARLEFDRELIAEHYPDLKHKIDDENEIVFLEGFITLRADCGVKTKIDVRIEFPRLYPEEEPAAYDAGNLFPHIDDRHIFKNGRCCLWLPPESLWNADDPNALLQFLHQVAVFFDKQLVCDALGGTTFPGAARSHGIFGYIELIEELLGSDRDLLVRLKPIFIKPSAIGRNDMCVCGSGLKFKRCHSNDVDRIIHRVGVIRVREIFQKWDGENVNSEKITDNK